MIKKIKSLFNSPLKSMDPVIIFQKIICLWRPGRSHFKTFIFKLFHSYTIIYSMNMIIYMMYKLDYHLLIVFIQYSAFVLCPVKIALYEKNHRKWKAVIDLIYEIEHETTIPRGEHTEIVLKHKKYCHFVLYFFLSVGISLSIMLYSNFWLHNLKLASEKSDVKYMVMFYIRLPVDENTLTGLLLSMLCQVSFALINSIHIWCWDPMVIGMMVFLSGQLRALRTRCIHAVDVSDEELSMANIIRCHTHYWNIRRCIIMLNELISPIMFIYILMVTVNFGVAIILMISNTENFGEMLNAVEMASGLMFQLLFFFWVANDVIEQNENLSYGIFESEWVHGSAKVRRAVFMLCGGMQERIAFTAGPFNEMSLATVVAILRRSYSFYTLLSRT